MESRRQDGLVLARPAGPEAGPGWAALLGVQVEGSQVTGVLISTPYGTGLVRCGAVVDATGNADIAARRVLRVSDRPPTRRRARYRLAVKYPEFTIGTRITFIDDTDALGVSHAYVNARAKFVRILLWR